MKGTLDVVVWNFLGCQPDKHGFLHARYFLVCTRPVLALLTLVTLLIVVTGANATDCPPNTPACKVLILTPQEEQALVQPNGIFQTAEQGRYLDLSGSVNYFRDKLAKAPSGVVSKTPATDPQGSPAPK